MLSRSTAGQVAVNFLNSYYRAFVLHGELANSLQNFYGDTSRVSILGHPTLDGSASGKEIAMHLAKVDRVLHTRKVDIISVDTAPLPDGGIQLVCHGTVFQRAGKWKIIHVFVLSPTLHRHATYYISSEHLCFLSLTEEKPPEGVTVLDPRQVAAFLADDTKRRAEAQERRAAEAAQALAQAQAQMQSHTQAHPQSHAQNQNQNHHQQQQRHEQHSGENRFNRDGKNFRERRENNNNNNNNNSSSINNSNNNTENNNNNREHYRGERRDNQRDRRENNQQEDRRENREGRPARKQREPRRDAPPKDAQNAAPADAAKTAAEGQQQQPPAKESKPRRERNKNRKDGAAGNNNNNNNGSAAAGEGAAAGQSGKPANKPAANKPKPAAQVRSGPTKDIRIVNVPASVSLDTVKEVLSAKGAPASSVSRFGRDQAHVVVKFNSEEIAEKIYKNHATLELSGSSYKVAAFYA